MKLLIKNGVLVDGTGAAPRRADLLLGDGRIERIAASIASGDARVMDAEGRIVCPGFINMHSHSDCSVAMYPNMESALGQGITTEFAGHCGLGVAPIRDNWIYMFPEKRAFTRVMPEPIGGINPYAFYTVETEKMRRAFEEVYGEALDWTSYGEFIAHLRRRGTGTNLMLVAGQAHIRYQAMGRDFKRAATEAEIAAMEESLAEAMDNGAVGLGLGLDYQPGLYASREELLRLMRLVAERGGIVSAHVRSRTHPSYGRELSFGDGLREFLELGAETGAHVHVCHIQNACADDCEEEAAVYAQVAGTLELLEAYRKRGLRVSWDVIPKHLFGPFHYPMAAGMFQPYVEQAGSVERFAQLLRVGNYRDVIEAEIRSGNHASRGIFTRFNPAANPRWAEGYVITGARDASQIGKTLAEAAGSDPLGGLLDMLAEDPALCVMPLSRRPVSTPDRDAFVASNEACIGMDTWAFDYHASLNAEGMPLECGSPATYCGMAEYLYDHRADRIEDVIRTLSGNPAQALGLKDRGTLVEGKAADVVVLDRRALDGCEHAEDPRRAPKGIEAVIVNGEIAVEDGRQSHVRSGRILANR